MATRRRQIDPSFWESPTVEAMSRDQRLFWIGIICNGDDEGWLKGDVSYLKGAIFRYDTDITPAKLAQWRLSLVNKRCIKLHRIGQRVFIQIIKWEQYQYVDHPRESHIKKEVMGRKRRKRSDESPREPGASPSPKRPIPIPKPKALSPKGERAKGISKGEAGSDKGAAPPPNNKGNGSDAEAPFAVFGEAKKLWRRHGSSGSSFGHLSGKAAGYQPKWSGLVTKHGSEVVLRAVRLFAEEKQGQRMRFPVAVFLSDSGEYIEGALVELKPDDPTRDSDLDLPKLQPDRDR